MLVLSIVGHLEELHDILCLQVVILCNVDSLHHRLGLFDLAIHQVELRSVRIQIDVVRDEACELDRWLDSKDDVVVLGRLETLYVIIWGQYNGTQSSKESTELNSHDSNGSAYSIVSRWNVLLDHSSNDHAHHAVVHPTDELSNQEYIPVDDECQEGAEHAHESGHDEGSVATGLHQFATNTRPKDSANAEERIHQ